MIDRRRLGCSDCIWPGRRACRVCWSTDSRQWRHSECALDCRTRSSPRATALHRTTIIIIIRRLLSDSTTSTSRGLAVQQVVRLAVRLADCCMQLAVDLLCTRCATSCPTCCRTCCLFYNLLWTSVVDLLMAFDLLWMRCTTCCYNKLYDRSTTDRSNGVRHLSSDNFS